mgnify:FL=1|jgi:hypothetical protein
MARFRSLRFLALALLPLGLGGCVVYDQPSYGYGGGYYAAPAPVYVAPTVAVGGWWGGHRHRHHHW